MDEYEGWQKYVPQRGDHHTHAGSTYFDHLGATLSLWMEVRILMQRFADAHAQLNFHLYGITARPEVDAVEAEMLPRRWVLIDMLVAKCADNYLTYLEHVVKAALREVGRPEPKRVPLHDAINVLRKRFGIELDQWEGREPWIRRLCSNRDILTHNRAKVNEPYRIKVKESDPPPVGTEIVFSDANVLEIADVLASSVRHIDGQLIAKFPRLEASY